MFKRKILASMLCLVMCISMLPVHYASASDFQSAQNNYDVAPCMEYILNANQQFSITNGVAEMYATVSGHAGIATKCQVTIELQEKGLIFWSTVDTWSTTVADRYASLSTTSPVTPGKTYRMVVTVTVWSGNLSESQNMTSESMKA